MYIITASNELTASEVPLGAFDAPNDVAAQMRLTDDLMCKYIEKAKAFYFNEPPSDVALWNTYSDPFCVVRLKQ